MNRGEAPYGAKSLKKSDTTLIMSIHFIFCRYEKFVKFNTIHILILGHFFLFTGMCVLLKPWLHCIITDKYVGFVLSSLLLY